MEHKVIELFIGKTTWHNSWQPKFSHVIQHFPEMKKWLEGGPDRQLTKKLWGKDEDLPFKLKDLQIWMDNDGSLYDPESKGLKEKARAQDLKGKAKVQDNVMDSADAGGSGKQKKKKKAANLTR